MQFVFEDAVSYDFRMLVENLAVRINGQFISQEQFLDRIQRAVENPAAYIQSQDPLFLARRLEDQQSQIEELIASDQELENRDEQIADSVVSLERELVSRGQEAIEQLETQLAELGERHEQLRTDYETLRADHEELRAETIALTQEVLSLREGTIVLSARTFFGGLRAVTPEAFRRVIEIRTQNPEVPVGDVVDQVNAELPDDEPGLHAHHVEAIYAVYFNDYPEE
jgi:chromosome segregation ATPase